MLEDENYKGCKMNKVLVITKSGISASVLDGDCPIT
jgi:hypothetical protein